jgi:hypothetical protein
MKSVATTLTTILDNPMMKVIMDKECPNLQDVIDRVTDYWGYDLYTRKPGPAYTEDGVFVGTDLDLACFLSALVDRKAVINIPTYKSMRAKSMKEGERVLSDKNRHGKILGLTSNKEVFTFGLKMMDMNVVGTDTVGAFRNFNLTNMEGDWYEGWQKIDFMPNEKENDFLSNKNLWSGNQVQFKHFVSPNRWVSLYGQHYFLTKVLIEQLREKSKHFRAEIKRMLAEGVKYPSGSEAIPQEYPETSTGVSTPVQVKAVEVEIDVPKNDSKFRTYENSSVTLDVLTKKAKEYTYKVIPQLQFATRATELAFHKHGNFNFPAWIKDAKWEDNYVVPGKRNKWSRLVLFQPGVGETGVSIRYREYDKTERVSEEYANYLANKG